MAFPVRRCAEVDRLVVGERLVLLTTPGRRHDPSRDRTRLIGTAEVALHVRAPDDAVTITGCGFTRGRDRRAGRVASYRTGA